MDRFFIYLLETGFILSMGYLGYVLLFRKETYFNFLRFYLLSIVVLSVLVPLVHFNLNIDSRAPIARGVNQIYEFKDYYERLVYLTNVEYIYQEENGKTSGAELRQKTIQVGEHTFNAVQLSVLIVYILGVAFFTLRFIYLVFWLNNYSKKNKSEYLDGVRLVQLGEDVPSFSYFNKVFINKNILSQKEFEQVFAHEKIHAQQKHSFDLILAQFIAIFQWFNPLAWRLHKSMKIVHEYIADRKVVEQGYELFDYQSLLLSQLAGIRSVELINNFNLMSIKKRIAMMNKMKSGFWARLKAIIALPILIGVFFACSDITFGSKSNSDVKNTTLKSGIQIPSSEFYEEFNPGDMTFQIDFDGSTVAVGELTCSVDSFANTLQKAIVGLDNIPDYLSAAMNIDKSANMKDVEAIFLAMRQNNLLKIAFLVDPVDIDHPEDAIYAYLYKLPPMEAKKLEIEDMEVHNIIVNIFNTDQPIASVKEKIMETLHKDVASVLVFNFTPKTSFDEYVQFTTAIRVVYKEVRNEYALKTYKTAYNDLDAKTQKDIRKTYPIMLTTEMKEN